MGRVSMLDIGEVAAQSGLPASTLRYYESLGLIRSAGRRGLRRLFEPQVLERLAFVRLGRLAGFTLKEIAALATNDERFQVDRSKVQSKAEAVEHHIKHLTALKTLLMHVANCPEEDHYNCPKFRQLLQVAKRLPEKTNL